MIIRSHKSDKNNDEKNNISNTSINSDEASSTVTNTLDTQVS